MLGVRIASIALVMYLRRCLFSYLLFCVLVFVDRYCTLFWCLCGSGSW